METQDNGMGVQVPSLFQIGTNAVATTLPYEAVEYTAQRLSKPMPDETQLAIMKASFPVDKSLIRHYAYLYRLRKKEEDLSDLQPGGDDTRFIVKDPVEIGE